VLAKDLVGLLSAKNRGDKTAIELFAAGVQGWEAGLRVFVDSLAFVQ
jgi:hypothetical protein